MKLLFLITILLSAVNGLAQSSRIESVYTDLKSCRELKTDGESGILYRGRCAGVGGYKIILSESEHHQTINLLTPKGTELELNFLSQNGSVAPSSVGKTIEWRIRREGKKIKPLALIARLNRFGNPDKPSQATSYLLIVKIKGEAACVTDVIEPTAANQNLEARKSADNSANTPCRQNSIIWREQNKGEAKL
jgi:hypothetical protein